MSIPCLAIELGNTLGKAALFTMERGPAIHLPPAPAGDVIAWNVADPIPWQQLVGLSPSEGCTVALGGSRPTDLAHLKRDWHSLAPAPLRDFDVRVIHSHTDIGLPLDVDFPERVGWDRLLAARAALSADSSRRTLVVVSAGTATTVDLIVDGVFQGGAILPGIDLGGRALHDHTQALPLVQPGRDPHPDRDLPVTGRHTEAAIASGLVWGHVGAVAELIRRQTLSLTGDFDLWLTGGAAALIRTRFPAPFDRARYTPHLALAGLALALGINN